jgi:DNA gyrase subunit A
MIINKSGLTIRMSVSELREMGRATQGVRLINLKNDDKIAAVTKIQEEAFTGIGDQQEPDELIDPDLHEDSEAIGNEK